MAAELARAGGVLACLGLAVLLVATPRWARLGGFAAWAVGGLLLMPYLVPGGHERLLPVAGAVGAAVAAALGALFLRRPWLLPVAALALAPVRLPVELGGERASLLVPLYVVVAGAAAAVLWRLVRDAGAPRPLGVVSWPLAAFLAWSGASLLWTVDLRQATVQLVAFLLPFAMLAVGVASLPWSRRWLSALHLQLAAMALLFAAVGGYQWLNREVFWNPRVEVGNAYAPFYRVNSVFWDPSIYGRFLVVAILASLVLVLARTSPRVALAAAAAVVLTWGGLVLSFSQSSFVALAVGVLAAAAFAWERRVVLALGALVAVLALAGLAAPQVRAELRQDLDRATSGRASLVTNGIRIAAQNPVAGVGLGGFVRAYADLTGLEGEQPRAAASHNTPVTVAAELGLPGLALLLWLVGAALVTTLRRSSRSFAGRASLIVGLGVLAIFAHSLFYAAFFEDPMTWGLLGLGALVVAWRGGDRREAEA
ncbi:MAG TPA: O-antigen ligase family protein [Gaiellaceae bacterium]|nr:O-antigen ligase family protein [Gaiellaceae bacterium]